MDKEFKIIFINLFKLKIHFQKRKKETKRRSSHSSPSVEKVDDKNETKKKSEEMSKKEEPENEKQENEERIENENNDRNLEKNCEQNIPLENPESLMTMFGFGTFESTKVTIKVLHANFFCIFLVFIFHENNF